ncbi:MAG: FtsX-like permease family protein, partial [Candidatus Latescibacteria bacterium]|nr:FtsX-like permease family protein [Candidatus Latescibacterota bacterium]
TVAIRNLARHKTYTFINVIGLAIGLTCSTLILLFLQHEFSYDRHHSKADRIYKVFQSQRLPSGDMSYYYGAQGPIAPAMAEEFPEVERATRFIQRRPSVGVEGKESLYGRVTVADHEFFNIFDFPLIEGNAQTGLQQPFSAFVTQSFAQRLFGNEDAIGKTITLNSKIFDDVYTITGILKDIPENSIPELAPQIITATPSRKIFEGKDAREIWETWKGKGIARTYILLKANTPVSAIKQKLPDFVRRHMGDEAVETENYEVMPLTQLYLQAYQKYGLPMMGTGDLNACYALGGTGLFIVIIACINFMNLSAARSARRMREVGLRKVVGAKRSQLIYQFLGESILLSLLALVLALGLTELTLPAFNGFMQINLSIKPALLPLFAVVAVGVGLLAGSYPAFLLSSFRPVVVLQVVRNTKGGHAAVRKGLVVIQFAISMVLIAATLIIYQQIEYMRTADMGFERDRLVLLQISGGGDLPQVMKTELLKHTGVSQVSISHYSPVPRTDADHRLVSAEGLDASVDVRFLLTDHDFLNTYQIPLLSGRNFMLQDQRPVNSSPDKPNALAILLNEAAAKRLKVQPGEQIEFAGMSHNVVGIFKDFHNRSLQHAIDPMMLLCSFHEQQAFMTMRVDNQNRSAAMAHMETVWKKTFPTRSFSPFFGSEADRHFYGNELKQRSLYVVSSGLAIAIACLGLLGLIAYTAEVRTKEIGIRKVLGATEVSIVSLLTKEFLVLVALASVLAWPVAYYTMGEWLQNFVYRIDLSPAYFIASTGVALVITLITIAYQALKAARANPVEALRYE